MRPDRKSVGTDRPAVVEAEMVDPAPAQGASPSEPRGTARPALVWASGPRRGDGGGGAKKGGEGTAVPP